MSTLLDRAMATALINLGGNLAAGGTITESGMSLVQDGGFRIRDILTRAETAEAHVKELEGLLCGRAGKLLKKGKPFIVVAYDEPYYDVVYGMIRDREKLIGRWSDDDETAYWKALSQTAALAGKGTPQPSDPTGE